MSTQTTGRIHPQALTESRLQLHYAVQFIAATGAALAEPLPDGSHASFEWNPDLEGFAGTVIRTTQPFRVALDPITLTLILLNQQGETISTLPLHEKTMTEGLDWLKQEIAKRGADADKVIFLSYPPDDFPDHPVAHGAPFDASQELALSELTDYYANTYSLLQEVVAAHEEASAIRIWSHHFDMATLITLPGMKNGSPMTIGVGLSPGDTSYNEPYWYVSPYPYPNTNELPMLEGEGFWHTQCWIGAVLPASRLFPLGNETIDHSQQQMKSFLSSAIHAGIALLNTDS